MKLIKKLFNSLMILLGIVVLIGMLFFAILVVSKASIFGIVYVQDRGTQDATIDVGSDADDMIASGDQIEAVNIETGLTNVVFRFSNDSSAETGHIRVTLQHNVKGFVKAKSASDVQKISIAGTKASKTIAPESIFDKSTKTLTIVVEEPSGFFISKNSTLTIIIPNDLTVKDMSLKVGDGNVAINDNFGTSSDRKTQMNLDTLSIEKTANAKSDTKIGSLVKIEATKEKVQVVPSITTKNLTIKNVSGRTYINARVTNDVQLESDSGTFVFRQSKDFLDSLQNVTISGRNPSVELGTISSETRNAIIDGKKASEFEFAGIDIAQDLIVNCNALVQVAGKIFGNVALMSKSAELYCIDIGGNLTASSGCGEIFVAGKIDGASSIGTDSENNLTVKSVFVSQVNNNLTIDNAEQSVQINNITSGLTTIKSKADITIKSVDGGRVDLESTKGNISVCFDNILGENKISTKNSKNIDFVAKDTLKFDLTAKAKNADKIKIVLGSFDTTNDSQQATTDEGNYKIFAGSINDNTDASRALALSAENGSISGSTK